MSGMRLIPLKAEPAPVDKYANDPTLWRTNPPWEASDVGKVRWRRRGPVHLFRCSASLRGAVVGFLTISTVFVSCNCILTLGVRGQLAEDLFKELLLPELSSSTLKAMFQSESGWFIPDWIKVVLDLLRYKDVELKERAIRMLMDSFSEQPNFIQIVKQSSMLVTPSLVELYYSIRLRTAGLQKFARDLGREGPVGSQAATECINVSPTLLARALVFCIACTDIGGLCASRS